ncbi:MAG: IS5/IS1182 family transposase, partial [Syntrophomonadaceae bacterium]|nr:IS5/IS1182 family transposase [Syntrophomonadaceae bacterium]
MAYVKGEDRNQVTMFPDSIDDYITEDNPVRIIDAFVQSLDVAKLGFKYGVPNPL